jgi:hypothetical protein
MSGSHPPLTCSRYPVLRLPLLRHFGLRCFLLAHNALVHHRTHLALTLLAQSCPQVPLPYRSANAAGAVANAALTRTTTLPPSVYSRCRSRRYHLLSLPRLRRLAHLPVSRLRARARLARACTKPARRHVVAHWCVATAVAAHVCHLRHARRVHALLTLRCFPSRRYLLLKGLGFATCSGPRSRRRIWSWRF